MTLAEMQEKIVTARDTLPERTDAGIVNLDADQRIVALNEPAERLIGMPSEQLLGKQFAAVVNLTHLSTLMTSGISFSGQIVTIGSVRLRCDFLPAMENNLMVGGTLAIGLAELVEEEASRNELQDFLQSASAFMDLDYHGIIILDRRGIVVMVSQPFADIVGTTPQAMIGKHVHQAYTNSTPSRMPIVMETGMPEIGVTHYMNGRDVIASRYPLVKDGKIIGAFGKILFKDVREVALLANRLQSAAADKGELRAVAAGNHAFKYDINSIVGHSKAICELKETVLRVAQKNSNVLFRGKSGTGKELFGHAVHAASNRRYGPLVKVNCAAIPEHLLESELFGYAEGAFTGAKRGGQIGKFEQAHTGTIFLDEIGDMPLTMQAKLLRVLQEKELVPLGSNTPKTVDVRVVAATNCDLEQLVKEGKFREDLDYRLNVVVLTIPPLRERVEDLYFIVKSFVDQFNTEFGLDIQGLDQEAWDVMKVYDWPGNIRELRNVLESAFNVATGPLIRKVHLPSQLARLATGPAAASGCDSAERVNDHICAKLGKKNIGEIMDEMEKVLIGKALELCGGNKLHAAHLLGISRPGLYKKLHKHYGGMEDVP